MKRRVANKILKRKDKLNYSRQQIEQAAKKMGEDQKPDESKKEK